MNFEELAEKKIASELKYQGRNFQLYRDDIVLPNGVPSVYEYIRHVDGVCVIPILEDGLVVMERQYRYPINKVLLEIPAGKLDSDNEDHATAARRELQEETGYTARELIPLGSIYSACAYSDETIWVFLAKGLEAGENHLDEDEFLDVVTIPLKDLVHQVLNDEIPDVRTQIAVLRAAIHEGIL